MGCRHPAEQAIPAKHAAVAARRHALQVHTLADLRQHALTGVVLQWHPHKGVRRAVLLRAALLSAARAWLQGRCDGLLLCERVAALGSTMLRSAAAAPAAGGGDAPAHIIRCRSPGFLSNCPTRAFPAESLLAAEALTSCTLATHLLRAQR